MLWYIYSAIDILFDLWRFIDFEEVRYASSIFSLSNILSNYRTGVNKGPIRSVLLVIIGW